MAKLSDMQRILLSTASTRESGLVHPLKDSIAGKEADAAKAIAALLKRGLVEQSGAGPIITDAGRAMIDGGEGEGAVAASDSPEPNAPRTTRIALVLDLLRREEGATLAELITATGWLPHTTHAALTGLRKKGHSIVRAKRGDESCYHIEAIA